MKGQPVLVVVGIDPEKHEIPALLKHHLVKMQKDFGISFICKEDLDDKTGTVLTDLLNQAQYVPTPRSRIITKDNHGIC